MKKRLALFLALLFLLGARFVSLAGEPARESTENPIDLVSQAKGAVLIEGATGRILFEKDCHKPLPIASTTKIMTALITLEQPNLDAYFTVDPASIRVEGTSMGLKEGDQASLRSLAYGMLLSSGNDAANAAAVRIAGSTEAFCALMNEKAKEIGMADTLFASPSGLDVGGHHSSAYDMALLARRALENDDFAAISATKKVQISYGNPPYPRWLKNHNKLLWEYEDCIGVKTGFTKKAGRCLVTAAQRDGLMLIAVTLGCPDDFNFHHSLFDRCFEMLTYVDATEKLGPVSVSVTGGVKDRVELKPLWQLGGYLTEAEAGHYRVEYLLPPFVYAPVAEGQEIGQAGIYLDGKAIGTAPLVASGPVEALHPYKPGLFERIKQFFDSKKQA